MAQSGGRGITKRENSAKKERRNYPMGKAIERAVPCVRKTEGKGERIAQTKSASEYKADSHKLSSEDEEHKIDEDAPRRIIKCPRCGHERSQKQTTSRFKRLQI